MSLRYAEWPIDPQLTPHVRLIWSLELDDARDAPSPERIVPDGVVEAIFHYGCPFEMRHTNGPFALQPIASLVSQTRRFIEIRPSGPSGFLSIRFHPWSAHHFVGLPLAEFADQLVPADAIWGQDVWPVVDSLARATSGAVRAMIVQRFLGRKLAQHAGVPMHDLARAIWLRRGTPRLSRICRDLGVTERQLERRFATTLGMTPKHFARLARFLSACHLVRRERNTTLAAIALQTGYYDQAHCTAEFQEFAGMAPGAFARAQHVSFLEIEPRE